MLVRALKIGSGLAAGLVLAHFGLAALVEPLPAHPFWGDAVTPRVIAHRGGRGLWPENTMYAFRHALALGVDVLEMDIQRSADGALVVVHDDTVDRTTEGSAAVSRLTVAQLEQLDAGYRWTPDGGRTYPLRGKGITVPTLAEVLGGLPNARLNLEMKIPDASLAIALCDLIHRHGAEHRVVVASFHQGPMDAFRGACPAVATSATRDEVFRFVSLHTVFLAPLFEPHAQAFQVPEAAGRVTVVNQAFAREAHRRNLKVEVWTVNEIADMRRLLVLPVDGIITDYPDRLLALLGR